MIATKSYVQIDERGTWRVASGRVSLDSVVYAYLQGHSAESIHDQFPSITLEDVYGAIAFYLANRQQVDSYLAKQESAWNELKQQLERDLPPVVTRLRGLRS